MVELRSDNSHPFRSLLILLLMVFGGGIVFSAIGLAIAGGMYGFESLLSQTQTGTQHIESLKIIQIFSSIGMFILPGIFFAAQGKRNWKSYLRLNRFHYVLALLTLAILVSFSPFLDLTGTLNQELKLPEALSGIEKWMLDKEQQMEVLTKQLLFMNGPGALLINLIMLAVIPAIGEEFIFRGCLQRIFHEWLGNHHAAIWIAAIIFSAIHVQFFGFFPRMLLGALFGYLLVWSGSLWPAIIGHFINNAVAVVTAYVYQRKGISLDKLTDPEPFSNYIYALSLVLGILLMWYFHKIARKSEIKMITQNGSRLD